MEVPIGFLDTVPSGRQFHIDLLAPEAAAPDVGFRHEVIQRWLLSDGVPHILVSLYALDLFSP